MDGIKVGDIVEHSGGYNCTQTQFYLIAGFSKSGKKAYLRELRKKQVSGDWMNGAVAPDTEKPHGEEIHEVAVKGHDYKGQPMLRGRINHTVKPKDGHEGWVNRGSLENFYKWDGEPVWNNCD